MKGENVSNEEAAHPSPINPLTALTNEWRREAVAMLHACNIDPNHIPMGTPFRRVGDSVFLDKFVLSPEGNILIDPELQETVVEEIEIRPPAHLIPDWIPVGD
jgi:hypothetical protein